LGQLRKSGQTDPKKWVGLGDLVDMVSKNRKLKNK